MSIIEFYLLIIYLKTNFVLVFIMEELKLKVEEFIEKHNKLEEKIDRIIAKYNELDSKYNARNNDNVGRLICTCEDYAPYIVNGPCRFCFLEKY